MFDFIAYVIIIPTKTTRETLMHSKNNVHWIGIDHDWKQRLESNPWSRFFKGNPFDHFYGAETLNMLNLRQKILDYAGEDVCLPFGYNDLDPFGSVLLQHAQPFELKEAIKADFMPTNMCYVNNCYIVHRYPELFELCYGFYMDEKGMWREHAWVVTKNNRMVELTNTGNAYFGINLTKLGLDKGFIAMQINDNTIRDYCQFDEEIYDFVDFINELDKKNKTDEKTR